MPVFADHPLTLARQRMSLDQTELARESKVSRLTVSKIERAVTRMPSRAVLRRLEMTLRLAPDSLGPAIDRWFANLVPTHHLTSTARAILQASPVWVSGLRSFRQWRLAIAPSTEFLAALLGINREVLDAYERGIRTNGMSTTLAHALLRLGISDEYLVALQRLPPTEE